MSYDDLLRAEQDAYLETTSGIDEEIRAANEVIQEFQRQLDDAHERKLKAENVFRSALVDLAVRRLAGEFKDEVANLPAQTAKKPRAGNETESEVLMAVSHFQPSPHDFTVGDAIDACEKMGMLIIRSTLTGILARLVKKEKLVVVEPGYRRRPTRYAVAELEREEESEEKTDEQVLADLMRADQEMEG